MAARFLPMGNDGLEGHNLVEIGYSFPGILYGKVFVLFTIVILRQRSIRRRRENLL